MDVMRASHDSKCSVACSASLLADNDLLIESLCKWSLKSRFVAPKFSLDNLTLSLSVFCLHCYFF